MPREYQLTIVSEIPSVIRHVTLSKTANGATTFESCKSLGSRCILKKIKIGNTRFKILISTLLSNLQELRSLQDWRAVKADDFVPSSQSELH